MTTMQLDFHPFETTMYVTNREEGWYRARTFYSDKGGGRYTAEDVLNIALIAARKYGVTQISLLGATGVSEAHDYLARESHTADRWRGHIHVLLPRPL